MGYLNQMAENLGLTSDMHKQYKETKNEAVINSKENKKGMSERKSNHSLVLGSALTSTHSYSDGNIGY